MISDEKIYNPCGKVAMVSVFVRIHRRKSVCRWNSCNRIRTSAVFGCLIFLEVLIVFLGFPDLFRSRSESGIGAFAVVGWCTLPLSEAGFLSL